MRFHRPKPCNECVLANDGLDDFLCVADNADLRASKNNGDGSFTELGIVRLAVTYRE